MEQVKINLLERTIKQLDALGIQYAVIDFDGNKLGKLEVAEKKQHKRQHNPDLKWGEISEFVRSKLPQMQIGDVISFTADKYDITRVRAIASTMLIDRYGKGSCTTSINNKTNIVEALRVS